MRTCGELDAESRAAQFSLHQYDITAAQDGTLAGDGEAQTHAALFERDGGLEEGVEGLGVEAGSGIVDFDGQTVLPADGAGEDRAVGSGGFGGVFEEVGEDGLEQVLVGEDF